MHRAYEVGGARFGVRTTSRELGAWLDHALVAYRISGRADPEYSIVVDGGDQGSAGARGKRFHLLYHGYSALIRTLRLETLGRAFVSELEARLLGEREDGVYVLAGVVTMDGITALVPSWLVTHLGDIARRVTAAGMSLPVARWVAIDPGTGRARPTELMLDVPGDVIDRLSAIDAPVREADRDVLAEPRRVDAVVTYAEGRTTIDLETRGVTLHRLLGATLNLGRMRARAVEGLALLVQGARCYATGLGRRQQMLDALRSVFEHERLHASDRPRRSGYAVDRSEDTGGAR